MDILIVFLSMHLGATAWFRQYSWISASSLTNSNTSTGHATKNGIRTAAQDGSRNCSAVRLQLWLPPVCTRHEMSPRRCWKINRVVAVTLCFLTSVIVIPLQSRVCSATAEQLQGSCWSAAHISKCRNFQKSGRIVEEGQIHCQETKAVVSLGGLQIDRPTIRSTNFLAQPERNQPAAAVAGQNKALLCFSLPN
jgi:hypothetical protein